MKIAKYIKAAKRRLGKYWLSFTAKHVTISVSELFFQHNGYTDFMRYDMIVRLLAVESYFGKNDYGFVLYKRMQAERVGKDWADKAVAIFKELIASFDENGYDPKSEILLDKNLHLIDGSHRMALAMYNGVSKINAKIINRQEDVFYGIEWFAANGFTPSECEILQRKYKELYASYRQPFICTIWHPVKDFFDEITAKLGLFGEVIDVKDYSFSLWDYKFYTRGVYSVDDIEKWKIEKKIDYMISATSDKYHIRVAKLFLESPDFRLKTTNNSTLSKRCELIKKTIRNHYKTRIDNYFHDIVIHIGDNFYQNRHIKRLFDMPQIDVKSVLKHIEQYRYVITKSEVDYMPTDFPIHYPLGKDVDIICLDYENYKNIKASVLKDTEVYHSSYRVRCIEKKDKSGKEYRALIRLEQEDHLVFLFDISCRTGRTATDFSIALCNERVRKGCYFIPNITNELMIRLCELHEYPHKTHHAQFIAKHISEINEELYDRLLLFDWRKIIKHIKRGVS